MAFGMEDHSTLLYEVPHYSLLSKPSLMDCSPEREKIEWREVQQSFPELRNLSVVERSCIFLGIG